MRAEMKSFAERNRLAIGTVGIVVVAAVALAALQYQRLPFFNQGTRVSAYFADAGGLRTGNTVEVSGYPVGKVSSISLDGPGVLVEFKVDTDVRLGNRTEVAIKTKGLLGSKFLDVTPPRGRATRFSDPDRADHVALPTARRPWRFGRHDQRVAHRAAVRIAGHPGADLCRYAGALPQRHTRGGPARPNPR